VRRNQTTLDELKRVGLPFTVGRRRAMVKGAGDPFLLHHNSRQAKSSKQARERPSKSVKRPKGTFRDPRMPAIVDSK